MPRQKEKNVLCVQHGFGLSLIHIVHSKKIAKMQKAGQREREIFTHLMGFEISFFSILLHAGLTV